MSGIVATTMTWKEAANLACQHPKEMPQTWAIVKSERNFTRMFAILATVALIGYCVFFADPAPIYCLLFIPIGITMLLAGYGAHKADQMKRDPLLLLKALLSDFNQIKDKESCRVLASDINKTFLKKLDTQ